MSEGGDPPPAEQSPELSWSQKVLSLHECLDQAGLPYAFGGAIALNYHREPRSTLDVNINVFIPPERREDILAVLAGLYEVPDRERVERELARDGQTRSRWHTTYVDVFLANTEFHTAMASRIERRPFNRTEIPLLSIEDLLICKALFNRPKDWLDIAAVVAAEGTRLDQSYVNEWLVYFLTAEDERVAQMAIELGRGQTPAQ